MSDIAQETPPIALAIRCSDRLVLNELSYNEPKVQHVLEIDKRVVTMILGDREVGSWWLRGLPAKEGDRFIEHYFADALLEAAWRGQHTDFSELQGGGIFQLVRLVAIAGVFESEAEKQLRRVLGSLFPNAIFFNPAVKDQNLGEQVWDPTTEPINDLHLSDVLTQALEDVGIRTIADLCKWTSDRLLGIPGSGKRAVSGIEKLLADRGLRLAQVPVSA